MSGNRDVGQTPYCHETRQWRFAHRRVHSNRVGCFTGRLAMLKASLWVTCVGLVWSATASAVPVYYTYGYFAEGRSEANGDAPTWRFTMEYDLDRQATYLDGNGNLVTQADRGYHGDPNGPFFGYYQLDYFHARLAGTTEQLDIDWNAPNRYTSFRQITGDEAPVPTRYEDVVRWGTGNYFIQLVRDPGIVGAPIGSYFPFIADIDLGPTMACNGRCGE